MTVPDGDVVVGESDGEQIRAGGDGARYRGAGEGAHQVGGPAIHGAALAPLLGAAGGESVMLNKAMSHPPHGKQRWRHRKV